MLRTNPKCLISCFVSMREKYSYVADVREGGEFPQPPKKKDKEALIHPPSNLRKISWRYGGRRAQSSIPEEHFPKHRCFLLIVNAGWLVHILSQCSADGTIWDWLVPYNVRLMFFATWKTHLWWDRNESILHKNVSISGISLR